MDTTSSLINTEISDVGTPESGGATLPKRLRTLPCVAFLLTVAVSVAAAVLVSEAPLMVVGLY